MAKSLQNQDSWIQIRCPQEITTTLKEVAKARNMTASEYVREAVTLRLRRDRAAAAKEARAA
jgi:predicted DNA-binding protein